MQGVGYTVPPVLHVGNASCQGFLAGSCSPVVARRYPFVDEFFCACLEEVDATVRKGQNHTVRSLFAITWRG